MEPTSMPSICVKDLKIYIQFKCSHHIHDTPEKWTAILDTWDKNQQDVGPCKVLGWSMDLVILKQYCMASKYGKNKIHHGWQKSLCTFMSVCRDV